MRGCSFSQVCALGWKGKSCSRWTLKGERSKGDITGTQGLGVEGQVDTRRMKLIRYFAATSRQEAQRKTATWAEILYQLLVICLDYPKWLA